MYIVLLFFFYVLKLCSKYVHLSDSMNMYIYMCNKIDIYLVVIDSENMEGQ